MIPRIHTPTDRLQDGNSNAYKLHRTARRVMRDGSPLARPILSPAWQQKETSDGLVREGGKSNSLQRRGVVDL